MSDYTNKSALIDSIMQNVVITTEEGLDLRGEIIDLIKNRPTIDEKEIIRKPFERVVERLKELKTNAFDDESVIISGTIEIVKEECGISE